MRITINAGNNDEAIWGMAFAKQFIDQKKDGDGTSESWGFVQGKYFS